MSLGDNVEKNNANKREITYKMNDTILHRSLCESPK